MPSNKAVFDVRENRWGRSVSSQWGSEDPLMIQGCLTPRPKVGDYLIGANDTIYCLVEVDLKTDPKDLFFGRVKDTGLMVDGKEVPTAKKIDAFIETHGEELRSR